MIKHNEADLVSEKYLKMQFEGGEKPSNLISAFSLIAIIAILCVMFFVIPDRDFSEEENRSLKGVPELTKTSLLSGEFTSDVSDYMADQFPFRDAFVGLKGICEFSLGKMGNNGVMVSADGGLCERFDSLDEENLTANVNAILKFSDALSEKQIPVSFAVMPRKMDISDVPFYGAESTEQAWDMLDSISEGRFINMKDVLESHKDEYIYYRTDHHYTSLGAYYTYASLGKFLGYSPYGIEAFVRKTVSDSFLGTTYSKAGMKWIKPDEIEYFRYEGDTDYSVYTEGTDEAHSGFYFEEFLSKKDKYASFGGGNFARTDVSSPDSGREKLLIVKDSFANALVPFLARHYDITVIDTRYYTKPVVRLAEKEGFSRVLVLCNLDTLSSAKPFDILRMGIK